jgi:hypothetical protein
MGNKNGSTQNGTVREAEKRAVIKNWLYLCSAFETQVPGHRVLTNKNTRDHAEHSRNPVEND